MKGWYLTGGCGQLAALTRRKQVDGRPVGREGEPPSENGRQLVSRAGNERHDERVEQECGERIFFVFSSNDSFWEVIYSELLFRKACLLDLFIFHVIKYFHVISFL